MKSRIYLLFPYLNTFQSFKIEDIEFCGPFESGENIVNNFDNENEMDKYHLSRIVGCFKTSDGGRLQGFTYSIHEVNSQEEYFALKRRVEVAVNMIRYLVFDKDLRGNLSYSQTTLYVWELTEEEWKSEAKKIGSKNQEFIWYRGLENFIESVNLNWPREYIYPPRHRMGLGYLQVPNDYFLISTLQRDSWLAKNYSEAERLRLIRAVEHYNKSFAEGSGVDDRGRVLSLCAGFESMLGLPDEGIQKAFRASLLTLLGDIPSLGDWAYDFYNLRSKIVHGEEVVTTPRVKPSNTERKKTPSLYYKHAEGEYEYIKHLEIGQSIFRKCLSEMLIQRNSRYIRGITSLLEPNEIHIKRIEEGLSKIKDKTDISEWQKARLFDEYGELETRDGTAKLDKIVGIGKELLLLLKKYLRDNGTPLDNEIDKIITFSGKAIDLALMYNELMEKYSPIYFGNKTKKIKIEDYAIENAIYSFVSFASHVLFSFNSDV